MQSVELVGVNRLSQAFYVKVTRARFVSPMTSFFMLSFTEKFQHRRQFSAISVATSSETLDKASIVIWRQAVPCRLAF